MRVLIVGTIRDASKKLERDIARLRKELEVLAQVDVFLVESDSTDSTVSILKKISSSENAFNFVSLGNLRENFPDRIDRIRFSRNVYVHYIRENINEYKWDVIVAADLDGMNPRISHQGLSDSISKLDIWGGLFANQTLGYYDIFALRSRGWVESDQLRILREHIGMNRLSYFQNQRIRQRILYSKMKRIPVRSEIISVESAFGGLGVYRPDLFLNFDYSFAHGELHDESEHVVFHKKCIAAGYSLGINPRMINAHFNNYNLNKFYPVRFLRDFKRYVENRLSGGLL